MIAVQFFQLRLTLLRSLSGPTVSTAGNPSPNGRSEIMRRGLPALRQQGRARVARALEYPGTLQQTLSANYAVRARRPPVASGARRGWHTSLPSRTAPADPRIRRCWGNTTGLGWVPKDPACSTPALWQPSVRAHFPCRQTPPRIARRGAGFLQFRRWLVQVR